MNSPSLLEIITEITKLRFSFAAACKFKEEMLFAASKYINTTLSTLIMLSLAILLVLLLIVPSWKYDLS
jgi:hypothetical protein